MTLTEYINQTKPAHRPTVVLQEGEYQVTGQLRNGRMPLRYITIPAISERYQIDAQYVQVGDCERLHTMDEHGNLKNITVFTIPKTKKA